MGKGVVFHLNKLEFPLSKDAVCQVVEIASLAVEMKMKMGTESFMTDRQTDGRITGNQKRFQRNFILHHFLNKAFKITCGI